MPGSVSQAVHGEWGLIHWSLGNPDQVTSGDPGPRSKMVAPLFVPHCHVCKIEEIKDFLFTTRQKDLKPVKIKKNKDNVKFKI